MSNTNYRRFEANDNPAAMALEDYQAKLDALQRKAERRRLDGKKSTPAQIRGIVERTRKITPMQSMRVLEQIKQAMMPEEIA